MWGQMTRDQLVEQKELIQEIITEEIAQRRLRAGFPQTENEQRETSMLKGYEAFESLRIYKELQQKYQEVLNNKGGVEAVIKELEDYIIALLGNDPTLRTDPEKRKHNPHDPLLIQQQKAALRALMDEAPGSNFGNFLDPKATGHIGLSFAAGESNGRQVLAYFWLAASDPLMQLDNADEINREQCLREEKMMVIAQLFDIRRAHNDGQYTPVDAEKDDPSCGPGTWGRIAKMHVHNKLTKMRAIESPAAKFKNHMTPFFIEKFTALDLASQLEMINSISDNLINQEKSPLNTPLTTLDNFVISLRLSEADEMQYILKMIDEYGEMNPMTHEKTLDENHLRFAVATYHEELLNIKDLINNDLFIRLQNIMINRLVGEAKEVVKKNLGQHPEVKKARHQLNKIEYELRKLQQSLQMIQRKINQLDVNSLNAQKEIAELKAQKADIQTTFLSLTMERVVQQSIITEMTKTLLAHEVKQIIQAKMTIKTDQIEAFSEKLVTGTASVIKRDVAHEEQERYPLSKEVASIRLSQVKSSPNYTFLLKAMDEQKVIERMVKNMILSQDPDMTPLRANELVKEWVDYQAAHAESREPSFVMDPNAELPKGKESKEDLSEEDKYALGIYFYNRAKAITERTTEKMAEYNEYINKAISLGVRCELAINPTVVKEQGIDQVNINPAWLIRLKANLEEAEDSFILSDASVGQTFTDFRCNTMISAFNAFAKKDALAKLNSIVAKLSYALDAYFDEISKEAPNQALLIQYYETMQKSQKRVLNEFDKVVVAFGKDWEAKDQPFFDADKEYLLSIITDSSIMQQQLLPDIQVRLKQITEKLAQLDLLTTSHNAFQETMNIVKQDILKLVFDFHQSMTAYEIDLQERRPKKGTIAYKQLQVLQQAKAKLLIEKSAFTAQLQVHHLVGVDVAQFYEFAKSAVAVANGLQTELDGIGQATSIHNSIRALQNGARTIISKQPKKKKELTKEQIQTMKVALDAEEIRKQKESIEGVKTLVKRYDHKRQAPIMRSFEETRRQEQSVTPQLTTEQSKMALDFIQLHADKPENINLQGYLREGVVVSIVDRYKTPLQLQFNDPTSDKPPQRVTVEVAVLKDYADRLRRKIEQRENEKYAPAYEAFGILFREYNTFGEVGSEIGRQERKAFVDKLKEVIELDPQLLTIALASQTREGLSKLSQTLQHGDHGDLLATVLTELEKKVVDFSAYEKSRIDNGLPIPNRHEWERATALSNQSQLAEAIIQKIELGASSRSKI